MQRNGVIAGLALLSLALAGVVAWQAHLRQQVRTGSGGARESAPIGAPSFRPGSSSAGHWEPARARDAEAPGAAGNLTASAGQPPPGFAGTTNHPPIDWRQVESDDYRTYIRNLRAIGCPEQTVQDIVTADIRQAFAARRVELMGERYHDFKFWKADPEEASVRAGFEPRRRALDDEMAAAAHELLGANAPMPPSTTDWQQAALVSQLQFLATDQREAVQSLLLQYAEVDAQVRSLAWGHGTPENPDERLRVLAAYEQKKAALRELLDPEEYERVDLTVSWTADNLRRAMTKFQPSEEEFRLIFREWRAQDENLARLFGTGQPDPGKEHVFARIETLLSPERYQQYRETWWK